MGTAPIRNRYGRFSRRDFCRAQQELPRYTYYRTGIGLWAGEAFVMRTMRSVAGRLGFVAAAALSLSIAASGWTQQTQPADDQARRGDDAGGAMYGGDPYRGYNNNFPTEE